MYHIENRDGTQTVVKGNGEIVANEGVARTNGLKKREEYFKAGGSEHCIGNLVLLYKDNNSKFNDADFPDKKRIYFDMSSQSIPFACRNLLHSMSVFAESEWTPEAIRKHRDEFLSRFRRDYNLDEEGK